MGYNLVECSVERCIHNLNNACSAQFIHIVGQDAVLPHDTDCHTFELRSFRSSITNISNINVTGVVDQIFSEDPVMNPTIKCSATECIFNQNLICTADKIEVKGPSSATIQQTECSTFRRK